MDTHSILSADSSIELNDNIIDDRWFSPGETQSKTPTGAATREKGCTSPFGEVQNEPGFFGKIWQKWSDNVLIQRISQYELTELKTFVAQKLFKVDNILLDEIHRLTLIEKLVTNPEYFTEEHRHEELLRKYGEKMVSWIRDRAVPVTGCWDELITLATHDYNEFRDIDPLCNWYRNSPEITTRMVQRIQKLAGNMSAKVRWSLLVDPGTLTCHLMDYIAEFNRLDSFFIHNELTHEETDQTAFNQNHLTKARNRVFPCIEMTRVKLRPLRDTTGAISLDDKRFRRSRLVEEIFHNDQVPDVTGDDPTYGTTDFIHANYVRGGPLRNTFICTQAPMTNTQEDFWRMVYQERCGYIFMLCSAVDTSTLGYLTDSKTEYCPYYWPRTKGTVLKSGNLLIANLGVDTTKDPLFTVTTLEVYRSDDIRGEEAIRLEHWQWDWSSFSDLHWPFRILRRARLCCSPSVVHCLDGVGRTGTLVALETTLMQFITGSPLDDDVVFLSAVFVRLQRRGAIANPIQYMWIYRCLLHWVQPFIAGWKDRMTLGLTLPSIGFVPKFDTYLKDTVKISPPY